MNGMRSYSWDKKAGAVKITEQKEVTAMPEDVLTARRHLLAERERLLRRIARVDADLAQIDSIVDANPAAFDKAGKGDGDGGS